MSIYRAYRGQHGLGKGIESHLPSLCFTGYNAAEIYAKVPNIPSVTVVEPKVFTVDLHMSRMFINQPGDAYLDLVDLLNIDSEFDPNSCNVLMDIDCDYPTYQVWRLLDDPGFISRLVALGYDGAIYQGSGVTAMHPEYRVFSKKQIEIIKVEYLWNTKLLK